MATPGELVKKVADVLHVPEVTIGSYYRSLREAGLVTKGGRGRSAAKMTPRDAACLLIAVCGAGFDKESAARIVQEYSQINAADSAHELALPTEEKPGWMYGDWVTDDTGRWQFEGFTLPSLQRLPERHSLVEALEALLMAAINFEFSRSRATSHASGRVLHQIDVTLSGPEPSARIRVRLTNPGEWDYTEEGTYLLPLSIDARPDQDNQGIHQQIAHDFGEGDLRIQRSFTHRTLFEIADLLEPQRN